MPEIVTLAWITTWLEILQVDKARHMAGDCPAGRACKIAGVLTLAGLATWPEIVMLARISAWLEIVQVDKARHMAGDCHQ